MQDPSPLNSAQSPRALSSVTHCPYCAFQCGIRLLGSREQATVTGEATFPVNKGKLCIKGWTAPATLAHPERLLTPLARDASGTLVPVTWDEALLRVVQAFQDAQTRSGRDTVGIFGGGSLTNEKAYLLGKFARVALGTSRIDYNGRFCMSSAAAAALKAFGIDRGLPFPLERTLEEIPMLQARPGWASLRAVQRGRVFAVDGNQYFNRSGPRLVESAEILAALLFDRAMPAGIEQKSWQRITSS